ncbi:MAG: DEAD/DEAH box helicase, partial [Desulfococcus multivorans]|nr:DEAD/DEAH box helicase [Desulfococcus multivorans]
MDINAFYQNAAGFAPNPLQQAVWDAYAGAEGHPALLVRAGTGAGKTEAVLFPALADSRFRRRIILILPSKALIEDMGERIKGIGERLSASGVVDLDITVDMGGSCRRYQCRNGAV